MVMRLGTAWGLMIISGVIPSAVKGISSWKYTSEKSSHSQQYTAEETTHLSIHNTHGSLLPVPGSELVPDLGYSHRAHLHLDELVPLSVDCDHHLVHHSRLTATQQRRGVLLRELWTGSLCLVLLKNKWVVI